MSNMDHQSLHQKVHQKISVMKTNSGVLVVFKAKRELKCQNELETKCLFSLLRFSDKFSDIIIDDLYLTLQKDSAIVFTKTQTNLQLNLAELTGE